MVSSPASLNFLFLLIIIALASHANNAVATENPAELASAIAYLGSSLLGQRYGVQTNEAFMIVVTILIATAFFSFVCPQTLPHHPRIKELTPYVPIVKITMLVYRPAVSRVAAAATNPIVATVLERVMCHVRSLNLPEDQETRIVIAPAMR